MGSWGVKNMESDGACQAMEEYSEVLAERLFKLTESSLAAEYDEQEHHELSYLFEVIIALSNADLFNFSSEEYAERLRAGKELFLKRYDKYAETGDKDPRRAVIARSFDKVIEIFDF